MDFWKTIAGLALRKTIALPLLALAIAAGAAAFFLVPTTYEADTSLVLATPVNGGVSSKDPNRPLERANPLLQFNDALKTAASIVIQSMNTQDVWTQLGAPKDGPTVITIDDGRSNPKVLDITGPYIYIRVQARDPGTASAVLANAQRRVREELIGWQKTLGAPPTTFLTVANIVPASRPEASESARWQGAVGAGLLVACAGLAGAYALRRRAARPRSEDAVTPDEEARPVDVAAAESPEQPRPAVLQTAGHDDALPDDADPILWDTQEIAVVKDGPEGPEADETPPNGIDRRFVSVVRDTRADDDKD
ncbi:hypothetical protein GCM10009530_08530 [Microbispora corallina]|uniref:Polysaccharide chain length determinant N-terminal domain-containing protein n=1 Tax=Microbispora corallina TaxID=83302 RepID=A0ABQ4FVG3_9ACTN|nr:hypothetical protein [Microbispora corallina]GIH38816.1 hypothetical protein Mco01_18160 [Microbispora corallina]